MKFSFVSQNDAGALSGTSDNACVSTGGVPDDSIPVVRNRLTSASEGTHSSLQDSQTACPLILTFSFSFKSSGALIRTGRTAVFR